MILTNLHTYYPLNVGGQFHNELNTVIILSLNYLRPPLNVIDVNLILHHSKSNPISIDPRGPSSLRPRSFFMKMSAGGEGLPTTAL